MIRPIFRTSLLSIQENNTIEAKTLEIRKLQRQTAENIVLMGGLLIEIKELIPAGQFEDYLEYEFGQEHGYTPRSAQNFMNVNRHFKDKPITDSIAPSVLYLLSAPSTPENARERVIQSARSEERRVGKEC